MYKTIETYVEVDVDLSDFDTDDLKDELESRGELVSDDDFVQELARRIWEKRRLDVDYQHELDKLIYEITGKIL